MKQLFTLILYMLLNSLCFAQLGQTGFNNTEAEISKQTENPNPCFISWLRGLGNEHNGQRYPSGTGSIFITPDQETWKDVYGFIDLCKRGQVETIMYVATMSEPEFSLDVFTEIKKEVNQVYCEYGNEFWLYLNGQQELSMNLASFNIGSWRPFQGLANDVYRTKANEYAEQFIKFSNYCKAQGYDIDQYLIWCSPYPDSKHAKIYLDVLNNRLGSKGFKQVSFHKYIDSIESLNYVKSRFNLIPDGLIMHGTELGFDFAHDLNLGHNDNIAFTDLHRTVLIEMFNYFNVRFATTWYHYGVGKANSNYTALVINDDQTCDDRLTRFINNN